MICSKCKIDKPNELFSYHNKSKKIFHRECKECMKIYSKKHYDKNKKKMIERSIESNKKIKNKIVEILSTEKNKPCVDCGEKHSHYCMDFDHLPGSNKVNCVAVIATWHSVKKLLEEIAKCELVCVICHRIRTYKRRKKSQDVKNIKEKINRNETTRKNIINMMIDLKNKPCVDCGKKYPHYCMDFDHLPEKTKIGNISDLIKLHSKRILLEEISKCELVCAVCHRIRTWKRSH